LTYAFEATVRPCVKTLYGTTDKAMWIADLDTFEVGALQLHPGFTQLTLHVLSTLETEI